MADEREPPAKKQKRDTDSCRSADSLPSADEIRQTLRNKFKFEVPQDFLDFWEFCKDLDSKNPQESLKAVLGLELVGPYDFLGGRFVDVDESCVTSFHLHWRYFYDPPEFVTVIRGDDKEGFHVGYYRDDPKAEPVFVCSNKANVSCEFTVLGQNLFAAINSCLGEALKKTKDKSRGNALKKLQSSLKSKAQKLKYPLESVTPAIKSRNKNVVARTFHKVGIVVPLDANEVGYRPLTVSDGELKRMLKNLSDSKNEKAKEQSSEDLQEIITLVQFANDECDYGMGLELGLDLFCFGHEKFHNTIQSLVPLAYQLLGHHEFAEVIEVHLKHRTRESLSQIPTK